MTMPGFAAEAMSGPPIGRYSGICEHAIGATASLTAQIDAPWWTGSVPDPLPIRTPTQIFFSDQNLLAEAEDLGGEDIFGIADEEFAGEILSEMPVAYEEAVVEGVVAETEGAVAAEVGLGTLAAGAAAIVVGAGVAGDLAGNAVQNAVTSATGSAAAGEAAGAATAAGTGAAVGAAIGSVVPGIGTALGAGIGAVAGLVAWALF